jgi:GNAT superfamily N-acetyltransferase
MIKIRKFKQGDERKISYLSRKCIVVINSEDMTKKQTAILYNHFMPGQFTKDAKRFKIYVAEFKGKVVGTATLDLTMDENWIRAVFVNPKYHGKGIGKKLMRHMENIVKKTGFRSVSLKSSPYAVNFYKRLGYKKLKDILGEVGSMTLMKKRL